MGPNKSLFKAQIWGPINLNLKPKYGSPLIQKWSLLPRFEKSTERVDDSCGAHRDRAKMNTDITASVKPEYPVVDRNPPFTKTVANFNALDYLRLTTITGVSVTVGYLSGIPIILFFLCLLLAPFLTLIYYFYHYLKIVECRIGSWFILIFNYLFIYGILVGIKPGIRGPSMVTGGLIGLLGGFMYAYQNSAGRLMGFFPNDGEVAKYKKSR